MAIGHFGGPAGEFASGAASSANPNLAERLVLMCASALFSGLTPRDCREIAACARARTFAADELLLIQGQPARNLILLQSGSVKHTQLSSDGKEVLMWMSGSGDAINLQAELPSCNHTCSARAMEQCNALVWEYGRLQMLLARYPQIRENISRILAGRLRELEERFREVATERVATRLALTLLRLVKQIGKQTNEGVQVSLSREELAQMTGTTLFTISRVLSRWAEKGFISLGRESVVIVDPKRLKSVSNENNYQ
jgi:CRP-like cAMP-binding protein